MVPCDSRHVVAVFALDIGSHVSLLCRHVVEDWGDSLHVGSESAFLLRDQSGADVVSVAREDSVDVIG